MNKLYIVEPRHIDGSYNVKETIPLLSMVTGITENELFDWYFSLPRNRHLVNADWAEVTEYLVSVGLYVREKTW